MRPTIFVIFSLLFSIHSLAQDTDSKLQSELERLHAKWFQAHQSGDGATMDKMEVDNLILLMPNGTIWSKTKPRAGNQPKYDAPIERSLSMVSVRRFGDTAVLTGILDSKQPQQDRKETTTMVFVHSSGQWKIASVQWTPVE